MTGSAPGERWCASCGRRIEWRTKWERDWDAVRHCSAACRRRGVRPVDRELEAAVLRLLAARAPRSTVCPSEVAREVAGDDGWRELMEPARRAARRLVVAGEVEITQAGRVVDPSRATGPIRLRRGPDWGHQPS
ncbi:DUF3253 domain-containing protein [Serinicoccus kebangsaanensis]|uniref:DUF3253 domain-containing protein n=1 Tax=Serinicoccus kebangsaanensis TaxID=2602069 RepID=UPI001EE2D799|nr:DUF3253 domain-containing protein [Serinicoccus kebangsaanensis]